MLDGLARFVYRLTEDGLRAFESWLAEPELQYEVRDEGLLKLFFAEAAGTDAAIQALESKRREHERVLTHLEAMDAGKGPEGFAALVLRYGIECNRWQAEWCERTIRELETEESNLRRTA